QRIQTFTIEPPKTDTDHLTVDQHLKIRIAVKAGPHTIAAAFPKHPSTLVETERQPYQARFNVYRHPRLQPAIYSISITGPYGVKQSGDTPSRKTIFSC